MLTTQLAYNPTFSALTKPQERPNSSPTNTASAIGLVETDSYETGEQSMQVVGNPQARSGKFLGMGMFIGLALGAAVAAFMANKGIRENVIHAFQNITGGGNKKDHEASSHRSRAEKPDYYEDEIQDTLPAKYQEKIRHNPAGAKNANIPFHRNKKAVTATAPAQEEAYA